MAKIYDNWDRLVRATLRREHLRLTALRTPSDLSLASSSSFDFTSSSRQSSFSFSEEGPTEAAYIAPQAFTFQELAAATNNFRPEDFLGEGGHGRAYKGRLESGKIVAVKQLYSSCGLQGKREFVLGVQKVSLIHHPNTLKLIGYCADGDHRLIVCEFMPLGSLTHHLHDLPLNREPLDWKTRMKIAAGVAKGLEFLHDIANPPFVHTNLKPSNILLDVFFEPKLSDFGLAKLVPLCRHFGDKAVMRVMETDGYDAPDHVLFKSDVYSFGVILLELITGRKAIDDKRAPTERNLVGWARPLLKNRRKHPDMVDPLLQGRYPIRGLHQALETAAMCLEEFPPSRSPIRQVVTALEYAS